jgi:hypothetical protein
MIENIEFSSVREFLNYLLPWNIERALDGFVFRGHSKDTYKLIPNALRKENVEKFWMIVNGGLVNYSQTDYLQTQVNGEFQLLREFYKLADRQGLNVPIANHFRTNLASTFDTYSLHHNSRQTVWLPKDLYEATALAQHYGIPTRLLDWSYDAYVALYFACSGVTSNSGYMNLWALNMDYISFLNPTESRIGIEFITPHYSSNPNLNAQKGLFTLYPAIVPSLFEEGHLMMEGKFTPVDRRPLDEIIKALPPNGHPILMRSFKIPACDAREGLSLLSKMGYETSRLFPGYDGVAKQILERNAK